MYHLKNLIRRALCLVVALVAALSLASCSEEDDTVEEYPNWQATNEAYFTHLSDSVSQLIAAGRTDWKRIKSYSKNASDAATDYIIVHVEASASAADTLSPAYTDSVKVHYRGNLLPSTSYKTGGLGYQFDASYRGEFDDSTSVPSKFAVNALVDGFATALQYMCVGDHWTVYIPHQLAYGTSGSSSIPGYSTLVFDLRLVKFWSPSYGN